MQASRAFGRLLQQPHRTSADASVERAAAVPDGAPDRVVHETVARVGPPSENHIHENDTARRFGFAAGLVPGVSVYAYMAHPVVDRFGRDFLSRGEMEVRLLKPFYDGETVRVTMASARSGDLSLAAVNPAGDVCATGSARLPARPALAPNISSFPEARTPAKRPLVSHQALAARPVLGTLHERFEPAANGALYLREVPEILPLYGGEEAVAPTGFLIRRANSALVENFVLPAWVHVSSAVTHLSVLEAGESFATRSRVTELFTRRGHEFVRLDVLIIANDGRPVMRIDHTSIYRLRGS